MDHQKLKLLSELANPKRRIEVAGQLAKAYGGDDLIIFVRDDRVGISLPADGFIQTLPETAKWQDFLKNCIAHGHAQDLLAFPGYEDKAKVSGIACEAEAVLAVIGGELQPDALKELSLVLPLLDLAMKGEQKTRIAEAIADVAGEKMRMADRLAESLDKARLDLANALIASRAAQEELRQADVRKNEFLALLAHELRNPLAPIGNALELLRIADSDPHIVEKIRKIMQSQLNQMVRLIDDLMDVSRITTGKILLKKEAVSLRNILQHVLEGAMPLIEAKKHNLKVAWPGADIAVFADATRLQQVFLNILNNAAKFTPEGGDIAVEVRALANVIEIDIADTGMGVPPEFVSTIFDMFVQADHSISRTAGGLGIGLGLARNLVHLHGGDISIASEGAGKGSTFTVTLPRYHGVVAGPFSPAETESVKAGPKYRVLIVDDNRDSAQTMGWTLEMLGLSYELAFDGASGISKAAAYKPNIVLLDIGLPDMTGYEVCATMKRELLPASAVFIAQTGWGQPDDKARAQQSGFDYHLVKPVNMQDLKKIIEEIKTGEGRLVGNGI